MTGRKAARFDMAIAGGGPAGAVAACLLARAGARVALVEGGRAPDRLEGLSPRLMEILAGLNLPREGVGPAAPRKAAWGALPAAPNREHVVDRRAFDAALRAAAADAGAHLVAGAVARAEAGRIRLADGREVEAGLVFEARGRRAPAGPRRLRGPATVAIAGWTGAAGEGGAIEAKAEGWVWRAANVAGGWTQIVADAEEAKAGAAALWARLTDAPFPERPLIRAAEPRLLAPRLDPALPRLGDAAAAMDPLSGHGLFWAVSSALAAQPLARALLDGEVALAARFHEARIAAAFFRQARIGRDFHRLSGFGGPFWAARAAFPDDLPAHGAGPERPRLRRQVVVRDGRLAEALALVTARDPEGVAFFGAVEIAPALARLGPGPLPPEAGFARALPEAPPAAASAFRTFLLHRGVETAALPIDTEAHP